MKYREGTVVDTDDLMLEMTDTTREISQELGKLDRSRWTAVSYEQQLNGAEGTLMRLCEFCGISTDGVIDSIAGGQLEHSRYTLSPPSPDKWRRNAAALGRDHLLLQSPDGEHLADQRQFPGHGQ